MKLTKEALEMLPAWVGINSRTVSFFEWLMEEGVSPWEHGDASIVKAAQGNCFYLYSGQRNGGVLEIGKDLEFAGIFHRIHCGLYDVKEPLRKILGIGEELYFPEKADAMKEAAHMAGRKAVSLIHREWDDILLESGCEKRHLIPQISRSEIRRCAEDYFHAGKTEKEICFQPKIPAENYFSDRCYLLFLTKKEWVAERIARQWLLENTALVSRQCIRCGCIRNEYREIKKAEEKKHKTGR